MSGSGLSRLNRRQFLAGAAGCAATAVFGSGLARGARRPNVIIIYTDDQGAIDANVYGAKDLVTPNIDALAGRGVRFTQFYAPSAICSPSRAGLLTGRYPVRAGVPDNCGSKKDSPGLPGAEVTVAEVFKRAGYATA
ncbi:MAG: sulfatase-like hydrolase/transferase, partial [Candidatus Hydrogenedentes bacterium]|nr:sulfatase-like hydrolase/transferase [Candidatus Hydrogenedentota bacterium]